MIKVPRRRFEQSLNAFTMLFVEGNGKRHFLDVYLSVSLGVRNFGNTLALRVIFFLKIFKI